MAESTPRERYRRQTCGEIKDIALRQLAEGGVEGVALSRIAKELGLSGPALYRYYASRDDLLSELIVDGYKDVADAVQAVDISVPGRAALQALAAALREWALEQPHRYQLIQGTPVPGFDAPAETVQRARAVLGPFLMVFVDARPLRTLDPLIAEFSEWLASDAAVAAWVSDWTGFAAGDAAAAIALTGAVVAWPQIHGTVSLETAGQFTGMGHRPETLLRVQVDLLADAFQFA